MTCTAGDDSEYSRYRLLVKTSKGRPRSWAALHRPVMSAKERFGALQEYYANTGALKNAAETAQGGKKVGCSIVETFSKSTKPRELEEVLRLEYRSKLLNPKWAQVGLAGVLSSLCYQSYASIQATCCMRASICADFTMSTVPTRLPESAYALWAHPHPQDA